MMLASGMEGAHAAASDTATSLVFFVPFFFSERFLMGGKGNTKNRRVVGLCQSATAGKASPNFILHTFLDNEVHGWDFF